MKIASWNVNSINARMTHVLKWCEGAKPDVLMLQEIKCEESAFPLMELQSLGYHVALVGQKTYNGVAVLSKNPMAVIHTSLPGFKDDHARYIEVKIQNRTYASIYVPNGQDLKSEKFAYKMSFYDALFEYLQQKIREESFFLLGGDFNVACDERDVYDAKTYQNHILFSPMERSHFRRILNLGFRDTYREFFPSAQDYSWWDYREGSWAQDKGLRIDYILSSPLAMDGVVIAGIDKTPRGWEKPSDHTPVWVEIAEETGIL